MSTYLFVSGTEFSKGCKTGAQRRYVELIQGLAKSNKVVLVCGEIPQIEFCENIMHYKISVGRIGKLPYSVSSLLHVIKGLNDAKNICYDCAISFNCLHTIAYLLCGKSNVITLLREDTIEYKKATFKNSLSLKMRVLYLWILELFAVLKSKGIIVQCQEDYANILKRHRIISSLLRKKLRVQINNIASWMLIDGSTDSISEKLREKDVNIAFIGAFNDNRKGHDILFPAVKRIMIEHPNVHLWIAGDGKLLQEAKNVYSKVSGFHFLGRISNSRQLLKNVDFSIVPSLKDSCPNTVLESLACTCTVYGSGNGGIPDILGDSRFLFSLSEESIFLFIKDVIEKKKYVEDRDLQMKRAEQLMFDWCHEIEKICNNFVYM